MVRDLASELRIAHEALPRALGRYELFLGVKMLGVADLKPILGKNYCAGTEVLVGTPEEVASHNLHCLKIVAFAAGEGTGDESRYKLTDVRVPDSFGTKDPRGFLPRCNEERLMEAFFPLFSVWDGIVYDNVVCLSEVGLSKKACKPKLATMAFLGEPNYSVFDQALQIGASSRSIVQLTKGYTRAGDQFGTPHAICFDGNKGVRENTIQVAAFVGFDSSNSHSKLCKILDYMAHIPPRII
jgi:hypothetical protein